MQLQSDPATYDQKLNLIRFFEYIRPSGILNICGFYPFGGTTTAWAFPMPGEAGRAADYVLQCQSEGRNCYFAVNPLTGFVHKKPKKEDIAAPAFVHVDVDPDGDRYGSYQAAREALLSETVEKIKAARPSLILDSGNGVAAYWRIRESVFLDHEAAEDANRLAIVAFGGDIGTHNIDRIMRIPFTWNLANDKKLRAGYPERSWASVIYVATDGPESGLEGDDVWIIAQRLGEIAERDPAPGRGRGRGQGGASRAAGDRANGGIGQARAYGSTEGPFPEDTTPIADHEIPEIEARLEVALREQHKGFARVWRGEPADGHDNSRSGFDFSAMGYLRKAGFAYRECVWLLRDGVGVAGGSCFEHGRGQAADDRHLQRCWLRCDPAILPPSVGDVAGQAEGLVPPPVVRKTKGVGAGARAGEGGAVGSSGDCGEGYADSISDSSGRGLSAEALRTITAGLGCLNHNSTALQINEALEPIAVLELSGAASDIDVHDLVCRIADTTGRTRSVVETAYKAAKKRVKKQQRDETETGGPSKQPRLAESLEDRFVRAQFVLAIPPSAAPRDFVGLATRYIYVHESHSFYDRLTGGEVSLFALNAAHQHLRHAVHANKRRLDETAPATKIDDDDDGPVTKPADALLDSAACVKVERVDYLPGSKERVFKEGGALCLSTWKDDGVKPSENDEDVSLWLDHLAYLIPNKKERDYLLQWMAYCYLYQGEKINHNILIGGIPRIGKDTVFVPLLRGLGESNVSAEVDAGMLTGEYKDWAYRKKLAVLNELRIPGERSTTIENKLKPFGASPPERLALRLFGKSAGREVRNLIQLIANTNHRVPITLATSGERWFCVWCAPTARKPDDYYVRLWRWYEGGGVAAVLGYLARRVDLSDFSPRQPAPSTPWREILVEAGEYQSPLEEHLARMIDERIGPCAHDVVRVSDLEAVLKLAALGGGKTGNVTARAIQLALASMGAVSSRSAGVGVYRPAGGQPRSVRLWAIRDKERWAGERSADVWEAAVWRGLATMSIPLPPQGDGAERRH